MLKRGRFLSIIGLTKRNSIFIDFDLLNTINYKVIKKFVEAIEEHFEN